MVYELPKEWRGLLSVEVLDQFKTNPNSLIEYVKFIDFKERDK